MTTERIYMQMHICIGLSFLKSDENRPLFMSFLLKLHSFCFAYFAYFMHILIYSTYICFTLYFHVHNQ
jgi:hypothetical protein